MKQQTGTLVLELLCTVLLSNHSNSVIVTQKITEAIRYYDLDIETSLYDSWMITGMALNLAYRIHSGLAGVIDPETVLHSSANKMVNG